MTYHDEYLEQISAALDGVLSPVELENLQAHLETCPDCAALYDQLWATAKVMQDLPPVTPPANLTDRIMAALPVNNITPITAAKSQERKRPWAKWLAAAAVVAVVAAGGYGVTHMGVGSADTAKMPATADTPKGDAELSAPAEVLHTNSKTTAGASAKQAAPAAGGSGETFQYSMTADLGSGAADSAENAGEENTRTTNHEQVPAAEETNDNINGSASTPEAPAASESMTEDSMREDSTMEHSIAITVGSQTFSATLNDSPAARVLRERLPLTLRMSELNGNEKYMNLDTSLPAEERDVDEIHAGDLMLFGDTCLVLFYDSFSTPYRYTPLGRVDDPAELAQALGTGDVTVMFEAR